LKKLRIGVFQVSAHADSLVGAPYRRQHGDSLSQSQRRDIEDANRPFVSDSAGDRRPPSTSPAWGPDGGILQRACCMRRLTILPGQLDGRPSAHGIRHDPRRGRAGGRRSKRPSKRRWRSTGTTLRQVLVDRVPLIKCDECTVSRRSALAWSLQGAEAGGANGRRDPQKIHAARMAISRNGWLRARIPTMS